MPAKIFRGDYYEDTPAIHAARVTASNATGVATGVAGEGNWAKVADITAISYKTWDLDSVTLDTPTSSGSVTVDATTIFDVPVTANTLWPPDDGIGHNFRHTVPAAAFPTGGHRYRTEYLFTFAGGLIWPLVFEGTALAIRSS